MRNLAIGIFVATFVLLLFQPLVETTNLFTEKVALDAAVMNSCRAAQKNSLMGSSLRDLNASVQEALFRQYFAESFSKTLGLDIVDKISSPMLFRSSDGKSKWGQMTVALEWLEEESDDFDARVVTKVNVKVETPYAFKTDILKRAVGKPGHRYVLKEETTFVLQVVN